VPSPLSARRNSVIPGSGPSGSARGDLKLITTQHGCAACGLNLAVHSSAVSRGCNRRSPAIGDLPIDNACNSNDIYRSWPASERKEG
jgi:hypothetical protein